MNGTDLGLGLAAADLVTAGVLYFGIRRTATRASAVSDAIRERHAARDDFRAADDDPEATS